MPHLPQDLSKVYIQHLALAFLSPKDSSIKKISLSWVECSCPKAKYQWPYPPPSVYPTQPSSKANNVLTSISSRNIHNPPLPLRLRTPTTHSQRPPRCDQTPNPPSPALPQRPNALRRLSPALPPVRRQHRKPRARRIPKVHANRRSRRQRKLEATCAHSAGSNTPRRLQLHHGVRRAAQDEEPGAEGAVVS